MAGWKRHMAAMYSVQDIQALALSHWEHRAFELFCQRVEEGYAYAVFMRAKLQIALQWRASSAMATWVAFVDSRRRARSVMDAGLDFYRATYQGRVVDRLVVLLSRRHAMKSAERVFNRRRCRWALTRLVHHKDRILWHRRTLEHALWSDRGPYAHGLRIWKVFSMVGSSMLERSMGADFGWLRRWLIMLV